MRTFTLTGFAGFLGVLEHEVAQANRHALEKAARIVEEEAKRVIGTYDYGWPPLAPSTLEKKAADTPLLETGEMRDSIAHVATDKAACIGSNNEKAVWHELGTSRIPPRPFLQGALQHKTEEVVEVIGREVHGALIGRTA
jgi:HK97 gp10 family phage protein